MMLSKIFPINILIIGLLLISCQRNLDPLSVYPDPQPIALSASQKQAVQATNSFSFTLFRQIAKEKPNSNIFISPFSISMALSMALNGANGQTFQDMRSVLGFSELPQDSINQIFDYLYRQLQQLDPKVTFTIANSVWYERSFSIEKDFLETTARYFHAQINPLNFADSSSISEINRWVAQNTQNKIKKILDHISRDDVLFLLNALYFKGLWHYAFNPKSTEDAPFYPTSDTQTTCKMMQGNLRFLDAFQSKFTFAQLSYGDDMFRMALIMPEDLAAFLETFNKDRWASLLALSKPDSGIVQMPKFQFSFGLKLNDILKAMGMGIAFEPGHADFTRLSSSGALFISRVEHKAFINVYESGTEAAAVTNVGFSRTSVPTPKIVFNRPFIFVIYEKSSQSILFMGLVHQPVIE